MKEIKSKFWDQALLLFTGLAIAFLIWGFYQLVGIVGIQILLIISFGLSLYHWLHDPGPWPRLAKPGAKTYAKWSRRHIIMLVLYSAGLTIAVYFLAMNLL
jgi:hypothetical protein